MVYGLGEELDPDEILCMNNGESYKEGLTTLKVLLRKVLEDLWLDGREMNRLGRLNTRTLEQGLMKKI